jgi:peptide deformylase
LRKIAHLGEPLLRRKAAPVLPELFGSAELDALVADMIDTMHDADGAGLAAPQVYVSKRVCVVEVAKNPRYPGLGDIPQSVFVNPIVEPLVPLEGGLRDEHAIEIYEGCLSVPGVRGKVRRPRKVRLTAKTPSGETVDSVWEGFRAAVIQHEVDHLDGVLFVDRADPKTLTFLKEYERHVPIEARYFDGGA